MRDRTSQVHLQLRKRILDGALRPAESLTEVNLAAEFGVSRNTIKKALLKLESENLVVIEENKRVQVRRFSVEEAVQFLEVRELLEGFVIRQSTPVLGRTDLEEMGGILSQMKRCLQNLDLLEYSHHNWRFHDVVYRVCPNRPAVDMIMVIKNQLKRYNIRTVLIPGRGEESFEEHSRILVALEQGNADEAERLMRRHMANLREILQKHFELLL